MNMEMSKFYTIKNFLRNVRLNKTWINFNNNKNLQKSLVTFFKEKNFNPMKILNKIMFKKLSNKSKDQ